MAFTKEIGLIAAGFMLGTVGVKMATSEQAKKLCVQAVSKGLLVKAAGQDIIEQAKSNVDDIIAEANYLNQQEEEEAAQAAQAAPVEPTVAAAEQPAAPPAKRGRQKK
jgi:polyhydroxyalkanoate synthesis regulator phasin